MKEIFDLDTFIFRCGFAAEKKEYLLETPVGVMYFPYKKELNKYVKEKQLEEGEYTVWTNHKTEPITNAIANLRNSISSVHKRVGGRKALFYLSGRDNFRERVAVTRPYKGNRDPDNKPVYYNELRDFAIRRYKAEVVEGIETDDACAIAAMKDRDNSVIVSNDKDLRQIPTWHLDWTKDERPVYVNPREAIFNFYAQLITGDSTDNIPGIPGIGPRGAERVLSRINDPIDAERQIRDLYREHFGSDIEGDRRFLETARLVRILRREEDREHLWTPRVELSVEVD